MPSSADINTHLSEEWAKLHPNSELPYGVHPDHLPVPIPRPEAHSAPVAEAPSQPLAAEHMTPPQPPVPAAVPTPPHPEIPVPTPPVHAPEVPIPTPPVPHLEAVTPPVHAETPSPEHQPLPPLQNQGFIKPYPTPPNAEVASVASVSGPESVGAVTATHDLVVNGYGLDIPVHEAHVYLDHSESHSLVFGGSYEEQGRLIVEYLNAHPNATIYGTDPSGVFRLPYHMGPDGVPVPGLPVQTDGFLGFFKSFMKPPDPSELYKSVE
jgi:hypothetical protein